MNFRVVGKQTDSFRFGFCKALKQKGPPTRVISLVRSTKPPQHQGQMATTALEMVRLISAPALKKREAGRSPTKPSLKAETRTTSPTR